MSRLLLWAALLALGGPALAQQAARFEHPSPLVRTLTAEGAVVLQSDDALGFLTPAGVRWAPFAAPPVALHGGAGGVVAAVRTAEGLRLEVFGPAGRPRSTHRLPHPPDHPFPTLGAVEGGAVAAYPATGDLVFFADDGEPTRQARLTDRGDFDEEKILLLTTTSSEVIVAGMPEAARPKGAAANVVLAYYSPSGVLTARHRLAGAQLQGLASSPEPGWTLVSTYDPYAPGGPTYRTHVLDARRRVRGTLDGGFRQARFEGDTVVLMTSRRVARCHLTTLRCAALLGTQGDALVLDALPAPGGSALVLTGRSRWAEGEGFVFEDVRLVRAGAPPSPVPTAEASTTIAGVHRVRPRLASTPDGFVLVTSPSSTFFDWGDE